MRASAGAGALIGVGLLLTLAAILGPSPGAGGEAGASLAIRLPDPVRMLVVALVALSVVILLALQRPRRPSEDDPLPVHTPRRVPAWVAAVVPALLVMVGFLVWHRWSGGATNPIEDAFTAIAELLDFLALSRKPATSLPLFDLTIAVLGVLAALALFALMVLIALADYLDRWRARRPTSTTVAPSSGAEVDDVGDPRREVDARAAILRAYRRFERLLAGARTPRAPWQTPAEFMRTTLTRLAVPALPVARLTSLFEIARFSDRPMDAAARDAACDCLDEITAALASNPAPPQTLQSRAT